MAGIDPGLMEPKCYIPGDSKGDSSRDSFWLDPERDPGHDDDEAGWNVGVEQVVAETPLELEDHLQASEPS